MKKLALTLVSILVSLLFVVSAFSAATCITTITKKDGVRIIAMDWTSHTDGTVSGVGSISGVTGIIFGVIFKPDGTDQPTDGYDVTIVNAGGADVLMGVGANLPQALTDNASYRTPVTSDGQLVSLYNDTLVPSITNAGSGKKGIIYIILNNY